MMAEATTVQELRDLPPESLREKAQTLRKELFSLRVHQVSGRVERPSQFKALRRQLAQVLTVLRETDQQRMPHSAGPVSHAKQDGE
jgi:large subunit ribosomal protein L29